MMPRTSALTLPTGTRRRVPKVSKNMRVPLWTAEPDGQLLQGIIRVPVSLCHTPEHTNKRLSFDKLIHENLERWVEWRRQRGWFISETPRVEGPFNPPEGDRKKAPRQFDRAKQIIGKVGSAQEITEFDYPLEYKWYIAEARFSREEPVYVRLDDFLFLRHLALTYGVDPDRDPLPQTQLPEAEDYIEVEGGIDPMVEAEASRQAMGLNRKDYLMGDISEPL